MYDFKKVEEAAGKILKKSDIKKAVSNDKKRKKLFSFLEGPPTANAPPALHHLEVRTYKDIINKFHYMLGENVPRKAGWDCHGLPVEVQIEKKLGLNSKKDIIKFGESKFIEECRKSVFSYINDWNISTEKLGYLVDLDKPYVTLNNDYIESVWWSLKQLYDKKLLYEGNKVVPFCPRCETPLSSHEVAQGYKSVSEESVYIKFKIKHKAREYILAWTTTPWTLPGNVALAVGKDVDYVKIILENGEKFILAKARLEVIQDEYKILDEVKGKKLQGMEYEPLFDIKETQNDKSHRVVLADFVTTTDGTGVVHTAVMYGEEDYNLGIQVGLPRVHTVGEDGKFLEIVSKYAGKFVKSAEEDIKSDLGEQGLLYKIEKITHDYPFCWRCNSVLLYYAIDSWFIAVTKYKEKLIKLNKKINWIPKHIKDGRFGEWLNNVKDWALSRKKFWGTPLPVWRCSCGNEVMIGSVKEMKKKSTRKLNNKEIDLHKPWIDTIKLKCSCGKEMSRVSDVIDCWYDSGAASFAQFHYPFENKQEFSKRYPYDFISEGIDQTRGWFYTLHVLGTILFEDVVYKNVICAGHIVDEKGEKMSKSKGNILNPDKVFDTLGIDATRLMFCTMDIGDSKRFGINAAREEVLPFLNVFYNTLQFYKQLDNKNKAVARVEDRWILSKLSSLVKIVTESLANYQIEKGLLPLMNFVTKDFSKTYIKMIRDRDDKNVQNIVGEVLNCVSRMLAVYAPNISEIVYKEFGNKPVLLSSWPKAGKIDSKLEKDFENLLGIIESGLKARDESKVGLKWPLAKAIVDCEKKIPKELIDIIKKQLNVKEVELKKGVLKVELDLEMSPELEAEGYARELTRAIQAERKKLKMVKSEKIDLEISCDEILCRMLSSHEGFIKERVNSRKLEFVTTGVERFKNRFDISIKEKKVIIGFIAV